MRSPFLIFIFGISITLAFGQAAIRPNVSGVTGAVITETIAKTYYVNQNGGSDSNTGTETDKPLLTIKKAISLAKTDVVAGKATKVLVYPGTYREAVGTVDFGTGLGKKTLFVLEGISAKDVIISGSDIYTNWKEDGSGIYSHEWLHDFGNNYMDWPSTLPSHRSEMAFVNGNPLYQKILENYSLVGNVYSNYTGYSTPVSTLNAGTFGVAERKENGNKLFIFPASGTNVSNATIEVAVRNSFINFSTKENLIIRNLTVKHFANRLVFPWSGEKVVGFKESSKNILVEGCNFLWNNAGMDFQTIDALTINNCNFSYNGYSGFGSSFVTNCKILNTASNFNMWRDFMSGGGSDWFAAGNKHHNCNRMIIDNCQYIGNLSSGLWFDIHCENVQIQNSVVLHNLLSGIMTEISYGPFLINKSLVAFSGRENINYYTVGEFTLDNTILYGAGSSQLIGSLNLTWYPRPGNGHWEQGTFNPGHISLTNNIFSSNSNAKLLAKFTNNPQSPQYRNGITASGNTHFHNSGISTNRFYAADWDYDISKPLTDFKGWTSYINEVNSLWQDPKFVDPDKSDFRLNSDSPLKSKECLYLSTAIDTAVLNACQRFFKMYKHEVIVGSRDTNPSSNCKNFKSVSGISLNPENKTMLKGETLQLETIITPSNADIQTVSWSSGNLSAVSVSKTGLVTAKVEGAATITVVTNDGSYSASSRIVVSSKSDINNIALDKPSKAGTQQLNYTAKDGNDGNLNTRWSAAKGTFPQLYTVDLESKYDVSSTEIDWATTTQTYKYKIEVSADNLNWVILVDKSASGVKGNAVDNVAATGIQYIKVTITGVTGGEFASIKEFKVYGKPNITGVETIKSSNLTIFPNPAKSSITVQGMENGIPADLSIYDVNGRIMLIKKINSYHPTIDIQTLIAGIYLIKVDSKGRQSEFKLIKN